MAYAEIHNANYFGRGRVQFCAPLAVDGIPSLTGYGTRWGQNWGNLPATPGELRMPPGRFVGNAKGLQVLPNITRANTSAWDQRGNMIVQGVEASITLYGHGAQNLADALHAVRSQAEAWPRTETIATSQAGLDAGVMLFTQHLLDVDQPVTVRPSWETWTEGIHWAREAFGVRLLVGVSGPFGSSIAVGYTPEGGAETLESLSRTDVELGLVYTGINTADGSPVRLDCYRAKPLLDGAMSPISEAAGTITLKLQLLPVLSMPDTRARWYRVLRGQPEMT